MNAIKFIGRLCIILIFSNQLVFSQETNNVSKQDLEALRKKVSELEATIAELKQQ